MTTVNLHWHMGGMSISPSSPFWLPNRQRLAPAVGMVVHSGDRLSGVANYVISQLTRQSDYHYAPFTGAATGALEMHRLCPLDRRAYHAAEFNNLVGVALTGPWDQNPRDFCEITALRTVTEEILDNPVISHPLRFWVRHSDVHPQSRRDPGPGLPDDWADGMGIIYLRAHLSRAGWESAKATLVLPRAKWRSSARWLRELGWEALGR